MDSFFIALDTHWIFQNMSKATVFVKDALWIVQSDLLWTSKTMLIVDMTVCFCVFLELLIT